MNWCEEHWELLKEEIAKYPDLDGLIADSGRQATAQLAEQVREGKTTLKTFDPLQFAFWAINANTSSILARAGGDPAYWLYGDQPEEPVEGYPGYEDLTWPRCPLCYLNLAHKMSCRPGGCSLDHERGYDYMLEYAGRDAKKKADELRARENR